MQHAARRAQARRSSKTQRAAARSTYYYRACDISRRAKRQQRATACLPATARPVFFRQRDCHLCSDKRPPRCSRARPATPTSCRRQRPTSAALSTAAPSFCGALRACVGVGRGGQGLHVGGGAPHVTACRHPLRAPNLVPPTPTTHPTLQGTTTTTSSSSPALSSAASTPAPRTSTRSRCAT